MKPLERLIQLFASSLDDPEFRPLELGFRYRDPDIRHFCLLKIVRAVSAFNAAIVLCRRGFSQEISVLLRTIVECTSHVEFVLPPEKTSPEAEQLIVDYFGDAERRADSTFRKPVVRQGEIHRSIGVALDDFIGKSDETNKYREVVTSKLYSKVYLVLSNYVHCKYPETMDLFGGRPGRFHLRGMSGTPKDAENISILESYFTSISQCCELIVLRLNLNELMGKDPAVAAWLRSSRAS